MFSGTGSVGVRSAAWRISLWATLAFAVGTLVGFIFLHRFVRLISSAGAMRGCRVKWKCSAMWPGARPKTRSMAA